MHPDRIRFRADSDDATRTIKTYRQIWKHKPASARGRGWGKHGEWQTRTPSFTVNGELIRTTEKDLALLPLTPEAAVQRFRQLAEVWVRHYTAQADEALAQAATHRDEALWPASEENPGGMTCPYCDGKKRDDEPTCRWESCEQAWSTSNA
jgi:hypothetical protein